MTDIAWLICAFPLAGFVLLLFGRYLPELGSGLIATAAIVGSFAVSVLVFFGLLDHVSEERQSVISLFEWVPVGDFSVDVGLLVDPLSITMALFITGVGALIHLYAIGYMHGDPDFSKFFCYLNLFVFSMLVLVLADNLALTFLGWEGVGVCSYLLISFWFTEEANASAGKKAFITNRVGDWGFMLAVFLTFSAMGSIRYTDIFDRAGSLPAATAAAITLLLFVGASGKSAQIPLFVWLPDAMAGPTPVSALIHAATMVTAGVYLLVRVNPVVVAAGDFATDIIAWVGVATALLAAIAAVAQNDIKKVLAYSTISQLGYMMLAVGVGAYVAAIFHMVVHAFFKALLFLGSGSVIHAMNHEQDIRRYGGLRKLMPMTSLTFMAGWLAIAGVPPLSGFWSKDEILVFAWDSSPLLWAVGLLTAVITAFYMSRLVFLTFCGSPRYVLNTYGDPHTTAGGSSASVGSSTAGGSSASVGSSAHPVSDDASDPPHGRQQPVESPMSMLIPMLVLAVAAIFGGVLNLPFGSGWHFLGDWLKPALFGNEAHIGIGGNVKVLLAGVAIVGSLAGVFGAVAVYLKNRLPAGVSQWLQWRGFAQAFCLDAMVTRFVGGPGRRIFGLVTTFDTTVVDGAVDGTGRIVQATAAGLRKVQTGFVRFYALLITFGAVGLLVWFIGRGMP